MSARPWRPKVIIFDLGGVFIDYNFDYELFSRKCGLPKDAIELFFMMNVWDEFERGFISGEDFWRAARQTISYSDDYRQFQKDFCRGFRLDREMVGVLRHLMKLFPGCRFWILSNINEIHCQYLRRRWPKFFNYFSRHLLSFRIGFRKPAPEIYERLAATAAEAGASPAECLFVDDREYNGATPRAMGVNFIQFRGVAEFLRELNALLGTKLKPKNPHPAAPR